LNEVELVSADYAIEERAVAGYDGIIYSISVETGRFFAVKVDLSRLTGDGE
jgi:hypothetical protein